MAANSPHSRHRRLLLSPGSALGLIDPVRLGFNSVNHLNSVPLLPRDCINRLAHPGGAIKTNKAAALAKFLERKLQDPQGLASIDPDLVELAVRKAKDSVTSGNSPQLLQPCISSFVFACQQLVAKDYLCNLRWCFCSFTSCCSS